MKKDLLQIVAAFLVANGILGIGGIAVFAQSEDDVVQAAILAGRGGASEPVLTLVEGGTDSNCEPQNEDETQNIWKLNPIIAYKEDADANWDDVFRVVIPGSSNAFRASMIYLEQQAELSEREERLDLAIAPVADARAKLYFRDVFDETSFGTSDGDDDTRMNLYETGAILYWQQSRALGLLDLDTGHHKGLGILNERKQTLDVLAEATICLKAEWLGNLAERLGNSATVARNPQVPKNNPLHRAFADEWRKAFKKTLIVLTASQEEDAQIAKTGKVLCERFGEDRNLYAANLLTRYGFAALRRKGLEEDGRRFLECADGIVKRRFELRIYELYYAVWKLHCAVAAQFAGFPEIAENDLKEAKEFCKNASTFGTPKNSELIALADEALARLYLAQNKWDDARSFVDRTLAWHEERLQLSHSPRDRALYAESLANRGLVRLFGDGDARAEDDFLEAIQLFKAVAQTEHTEENRTELACALVKQNSVYCRLAQLACRAGNCEEARDYLNRAIEAKKALLNIQRLQNSKKYFGRNPFYHRARYFKEAGGTRYFKLVDYDRDAKDIFRTSRGYFVRQMTDEEVQKKEEQWSKILAPRFAAEKIIDAAIDCKQGEYEKALQKTNELYESLRDNDLETTLDAVETLQLRDMIETKMKEGSAENTTSEE